MHVGLALGASRRLGGLWSTLCSVVALTWLSACGGGGGGGAAPPVEDVPATGTVTIPADSGIQRIAVGDTRLVVDAWPGEVNAKLLIVEGRDAAARYAVSVLEGASKVRAVEDGGQWRLEVDTRGVAGGAAFAFRLQIRDMASGATADLRAPVQVLNPQLLARAVVDAAGGRVEAPDGSLRAVFDANAGAQPLTVSLMAADRPDGRRVRLLFDRDVSADPRPVRLEVAEPAPGIAATARAPAATADNNYDVWMERHGVFTAWGGYRLDGLTRPLSRLAGWGCVPAVFVDSVGDRSCFDVATAVRLRGIVAPGATGLAAAEPVLFVHGYARAATEPVLGGTGWGRFPELVNGVPTATPGRTALPFLFEWATNARFEQVADELARAVDALHAATGRPVTVVAHSFGGVLVRTMLQGHGRLGTAASLQVSGKVAQVVTLGTPHAGISPLPRRVGEIDLPVGVDPAGVSGTLSLGCLQITCHQAGKPALSDATAAMVGLDDATPGALIASLADPNGEPLPNEVPFLVGIGLGVSELGLVGTGDGLISFDGQRFDPAQVRDPDSGDAPLLNCASVLGARVREVALTADGALPGNLKGLGTRGLVHTDFQLLDYPPLLQDAEANVDDADHPSLRQVRSVLANGVCPSLSPWLARKGRLANCARPCVLAATADGRLFGAGTDPDPDGFHPLGSPGVAPGPWFPLSSSLPPVRQVTSGSGSSMLAGTDGSLWVTGNGAFGRLGDDAVGSDTWKRIDGMTDVRAVVGRGIASYAITGGGQLWMAGANTEGQAGFLLPPGQSFVTRWARVTAIPDALLVASDGVHTLVLRSDKTVWAAGQNSRGSESVLGFGAGGDALNIREWRAVPGLAGIVDIATGSMHSLALTEGGRIWATGNAPSGSFSSFGWTPQLAFAEVPGIDDVKFITAGSFCSMAIKSDGSLWVAGLFGEGASGAGAGAPVTFTAWTQITTAPPLAAVQTDCTRSLAIDREGGLHATGSNELGGIGLGNPQASGLVQRATLVWTRINLGNGF